MTKAIFTATASLALLALAGCSHADPNSPSGKRHAAFETIGDASKKLKGIFEGAAPDLASAAAPVASLKAAVAQLPGLFPAGSGPDGDQPTEARADIWTKPAEFAAELKRLQDATAALDATVAAGDAAGAVVAYAALGKTCKSCHTKFKED